ncbi:MAG: helix-turn-helix transcriptional regulator [Ruminococcaceae bacterium]|nr:helix-turn-helix transcriptional regulator [Oscillospiraceae bacterium]
MSVGENIKKYRKQKGMTQKELADAIGVSVQAISKWECGATPDITQILPLAAALGASANELLGYADQKKELEDGWIEFLRAHREGSLEIIEYEKSVLAQYPNDETFLYRLATDYRIHADMSEDPIEKERYLQMAKAQFISNLQKFPQDEITRGCLVDVCMKLGDREEAMRYASESTNKDEILKYAFKGEELKQHRQKLIDQYLVFLIGEMLSFKNAGPEEWRIAKNIIRAAIPDGNYQRYERYLWMLDMRLSGDCLKNRDFDGAMEVLADTVHRIRAAKAFENLHAFTSPILYSRDTDREPYKRTSGEVGYIMIDRRGSRAENLYNILTTADDYLLLADRTDYRAMLAELEELKKDAKDAQ